jgi:apolipoprotein N-acyltransferase
MAPFDLWPLALFSAALLFLAVERAPPSSARSVAWLGFVFGLGKYGLGASWVYVSIHEHGGASVVLAGSLVALFVAFLALFPATQLWLYGRLRAQAGGAAGNGVLFAALWVFWEWLLTWFLSGFPWLFAGAGQLSSPLAGYGPVGGVLLMSLAAVSAGVLLALGVLAWQRGARRDRALWLPWAMLALIFAGGAVLRSVSWTTPGAMRTAALVQGNIAQATKWRAEQRSVILQKMQRLSAPHWGVDLMLWPEASITLYEHQAGAYLERWGERGRAEGTTLILGLPGVEALPAVGDAPAYTFSNRAVAVGAGSGRYSKRRLVPFGEYVPLEGLLRGLIRFFDLPMSHASPGPDAQPLLKAGAETAAMAICYEIAYPALVQGDMPADVLLTISNDAWFGRSTGPEQHRQLAQLRALELGRWLLRATNTGHTVIVDHRGRVTQALPRFAEGVLTGPYQVRQGLTPFARIGQGPVLFAIVLALALVVFLRARFRPASAESPKP